MRSIGLPKEADSPLIVDPNGPLSGSVALQFFQPVAWQLRQITEDFGCRYRSQLAFGRGDQVWRKVPRTLALSENRSAPAFEAANCHRASSLGAYVS
jgi:hypothetical protein